MGLKFPIFEYYFVVLMFCQVSYLFSSLVTK